MVKTRVGFQSMVRAANTYNQLHGHQLKASETGLENTTSCFPRTEVKLVPRLHATSCSNGEGYVTLNFHEASGDYINPSTLIPRCLTRPYPAHSPAKAHPL